MKAEDTSNNENSREEMLLLAGQIQPDQLGERHIQVTFMYKQIVIINVNDYYVMCIFPGSTTALPC